MQNLDIVNTAAQLEVCHSSLNEMAPKDSLDMLGFENCTVINTGIFDGQPYTKAIAIKDGNDNVHVHFYGTGDGNWHFNAVTYGVQPDPSEMQEWALDFFDKIVKNDYEGKSLGNLYVTGHSQGGNNAQFVAMRSEYGDYISTCISLDGPGFSHQFVDESKALYGEAYYESQRSKVWAYNGENDYISILGQESIIKDEQEKYIAYAEKDFNFAKFHMAEGLLKDGKISLTGDNSQTGDDSQFRKYLRDVFDKVKDLPPENQARAAELVMMLCEDFVGGGPIKSDMTVQEFNELKEILVPFLVAVLADFPDADRITDILGGLGLDVSRPMIESILGVVGLFNSYPPEIREQLIHAILSAVDYENYKFSLNKSGVPKALVAAWPLLSQTLLTHPEDIDTILRELGLDVVLTKWIQDNPWKFTGYCILAAFIALSGAFVDVAIRKIQEVRELANKTKEDIVQLLTAMKKAIAAVKEWLRNNFNAGVRYVSSNPYFKADPVKLRHYATRINNVNNRLRMLDADLRSLYGQVGLLDLWDIIVANIMTSGSPTLMQVNTYLNGAADRLENADKKARSYMGG